MSSGADAGGGAARAATVDDLKQLLTALDAEQVDYVLIGGYALYALGYQRALLSLPDRVAAQLDPDWFSEGENIRVADAFVVDLMFNACGESIDSLRGHIRTIDLEGVPLRTLDLEGLLKTKQTARAKDRDDCVVLERALAALKRSGGGTDRR